MKSNLEIAKSIASDDNENTFLKSVAKHIVDLINGDAEEVIYNSEPCIRCHGPVYLNYTVVPCRLCDECYSELD